MGRTCARAHAGVQTRTSPKEFDSALSLDLSNNIHGNLNKLSSAKANGAPFIATFWPVSIPG